MKANYKLPSKEDLAFQEGVENGFRCGQIKNQGSFGGDKMRGKQIWQ